MWAKRRAWAWPGRCWCWLSDHSIISIAITWPGFQAATQKSHQYNSCRCLPPPPPHPTFFSLASSNSKWNPVFWWFHKCFHSSPKSSVAWVYGKFSKKSHIWKPEGRRNTWPEIILCQNSCDDRCYRWAVTNDDQPAHPQLLWYSVSCMLLHFPPTFPHSIFLRVTKLTQNLKNFHISTFFYF